MESLALRSRRRRIIERPRLLRALDRSDAQVRTLVASAGYGKTTLAEQWSAVLGRRTGWYRARPSASDVAVVARGFVQASDEIVPGAGSRLLERLAVTQDPDRDAAVLAEMLAVDLESWPGDAWIVVDDYQCLQAAPDPETFVETLVRNAPVRLLLIGRNRPRFVTSRDVLYGDVLEVGRAALAMTAEEIDEVLGEGARDISAGLLALAEGWPAVVALSSASGSPTLAPGTDVPEELFDFFAEEVFRRLDAEVQSGLACLARFPLVDSEVADLVLGHQLSQMVMSEALNTGIVELRGGVWEFHPLAASFLQRRASGNLDGLERWRDVLTVYRERAEWDASFTVASRLAGPEEAALLLRDGARQLLASGRLGTLEAWLEDIRKAGLESVDTRVAEAQLCLRQGRHVTALTLLHGDLAEPPADESGRFGVFQTAAFACHIAAREEDAFAHYSAALGCASTRREQRAALEGQLVSSAALEMPLAHDLLEQLRATVDSGSPTELVRLADRTLSSGFRFGVNRVRDVSHIGELLDRTTDPLTRTSFRCLFGWGLILECGYQRALGIAERALHDAQQYRLKVTLPYVLSVRAAALAGLHLTDKALAVCRESHEVATELGDSPGRHNAYALRLRILAASGAAADACRLEPPDMNEAMPFVRGEVCSSRALALASAGRISEAEELALEAAESSSGVETRVLAASVLAACAARSRAPSLSRALDSLLDGAFDANALDPVVCTYRGNPELLAALLQRGKTRDRTMYIVQRASDEPIAEPLLCDPGDVGGTQLSPREQDVFELLCEGLSNTEIAKRLFISQSTVKVHVHHIFDKVGIRSRSALVINHALRRHAASAESVAERPSKE